MRQTVSLSAAAGLSPGLRHRPHRLHGTGVGRQGHHEQEQRLLRRYGSNLKKIVLKTDLYKQYRK